jgi:8-oxo-dGTP diphosphatase
VAPLAGGLAAVSRPPAVVEAAGAVLWRPARAAGGGIEVGIVHRPKYDDWSLPKGKLDAGEHLVACAVREVLEETGHAVRLGAPLGVQRYPVTDAVKQVHYWTARADDHAPPWPGTVEIDRLEFVDASRAAARLSHSRDVELVAQAAALLSDPPVGTTPLVLLRHAKALARKRWRGTDPDRPLDPKGTAQADRLAVLLACFGIERVVSSDALRCVDTVRPYATAARVHVELEPRVTEEAHSAGSGVDGVTAAVHELLTDPRPAVLCSHRPVLPDIFAALGAVPASPFPGPEPTVEPLSPGTFVVLHRRFSGGVPGVVAVERHDT